MDNRNIKRDCKYYKKDAYCKGCKILKDMICRNKSRNKKCLFYKKKMDTSGQKKRTERKQYYI